MKNQLERQRLTWEDVVRKDVGALRGSSNWSVQALDWENWRQGCIFMLGWSQWPISNKKKRKNSYLIFHI